MTDNYVDVQDSRQSSVVGGLSSIAYKLIAPPQEGPEQRNGAFHITAVDEL